MELVKDIGVVLSLLLSFSTLAALFSGLFRKKVSKIIEESVKPNESVKGIEQIKGMLSAHIAQDELKYEVLEKVANGLLAALRNTILYLSNKFIKRGWVTQLEKQNLIDLYEAYHDLGGDSYATNEFERALDIPVHGR